MSRLLLLLLLPPPSPPSSWRSRSFATIRGFLQWEFLRSASQAAKGFRDRSAPMSEEKEKPRSEEESRVINDYRGLGSSTLIFSLCLTPSPSCSPFLCRYSSHSSTLRFNPNPLSPGMRLNTTRYISSGRTRGRA